MKKRKSFHIATLLAATALTEPFIGDPEKLGMIEIVGGFITPYDRDELPVTIAEGAVTLKTAIRVDDGAYLIGLAGASAAVEPTTDQFKVVAKLLEMEYIEQVAGKYIGAAQFALVCLNESGEWSVDRAYENVVDVVDVTEFSMTSENFWLGMADGTIRYLNGDYTIGQRVGGDLAIQGLKSIMRPYTEDDGELRTVLNTVDDKYYPFKIELLDNGEVVFVAIDAASDLNVEVYAKQGSEFVVGDANGFKNIPATALYASGGTNVGG